MPKGFCRSLSIQVKWRFPSLWGPCGPRTTGWGLMRFVRLTLLRRCNDWRIYGTHLIFFWCDNDKDPERVCSTTQSFSLIFVQSQTDRQKALHKNPLCISTGELKSFVPVTAQLNGDPLYEHCTVVKIRKLTEIHIIIYLSSPSSGSYLNQNNHFSITNTTVNMAAFTNSMDFHVTFLRFWYFLWLLHFAGFSWIMLIAKWKDKLFSLDIFKQLSNYIPNKVIRTCFLNTSQCTFHHIATFKMRGWVGKTQIKNKRLNISSSNQRI